MSTQDAKESSSYWNEARFANMDTLCCVHMDPVILTDTIMVRFPCGHTICYSCFMCLRQSICCVCRRPLALEITPSRPRIEPIDPFEEGDVVFLRDIAPSPSRRSQRRRRRRARRQQNLLPIDFSISTHSSERSDPPPRLIQSVLTSHGLRLLDEPFDINSFLL